MALGNPAFSNSPAFNGKGVPAIPTPSAEQLQQQFELPSIPQPSATPMTVDGTLRVTLLNFVVLLVGAAFGWITATMIPGLWIGALVIGLVLGLVNSFKKEPVPALILAYAAVEGVFVGAISRFYEFFAGGAVGQAVLATLVVVGITLALFASGKVRVTPKLNKIFLVAMLGYLAFSVINLVLMWTGVNDDPWGLRSSVTFFGIPLGLVLGAFAVLLGAYSLVIDFDFIQKGVQNKVDKKYQWTGAFGILVTVVWLYLEILRMIAISRD